MQVRFLCRWRQGRLLGVVRCMSCHEVLTMLMRDGDAGHACLGNHLGEVLEGWECLRGQPPGFGPLARLCFVAHITLRVCDEGVSRCAALASYKGARLLACFIFVPSVARRYDREVPWTHFNGFGSRIWRTRRTGRGGKEVYVCLRTTTPYLHVTWVQ